MHRDKFSAEEQVLCRVIIKIFVIEQYPVARIPALLRGMADDLDQTIANNPPCSCSACMRERAASNAPNN